MHEIKFLDLTNFERPVHWIFKLEIWDALIIDASLNEPWIMSPIWLLKLLLVSLRICVDAH